MNIVILAGGTGSIPLQRGMYRSLEECLDGIDIKIIVNAYDNGLSTGAVRAVMDGKILGPSDVRKNQATRLQLINPSSPWLKFLDYRFTSEPAVAFNQCAAQAKRLSEALGREDIFNFLCGAIEKYFSFPAAMTVQYNDFSLANIIYAGVAANNGFSLRSAARIMAATIGIPDNVLLNDDAPLYLGAITRSGERVFDEAQIVAWDKESDPFVDVFFVDPAGQESNPELCVEAWRAILDADLLILSSGTPWSSLIPTYVSAGFKEAITKSKVAVVMVMNRSPDRDSPGQSGSDFIDLMVPRYFEAGRLHVLADSSSHRNFLELSDSARANVASFTIAELSSADTPANQHDPSKLAQAIASVYFDDYMRSDLFVFDYDDTLCSRERSQLQKTNRANVAGIAHLNSLTKVAICTGNTVNAIDLRTEPAGSADEPRNGNASLHVFADGGVNEYFIRSDAFGLTQRVELNPEKCISPNALLERDGPYSAAAIVSALERVGIPRELISIRGNAVIAIRPIDRKDRAAVMSVASRIVKGSDLHVREAGTSTIEICKLALSKSVALKHLFSPSNGRPRITYIGDELECGNDQEIADLAREATEIKCLHVRSPAKTAFFIRTLTSHLNGHAKH
jgi:2-phospho-L-lactate transferase/gluconeogenesis factor (CofD/UPF0052 family)